MEAFPEPSNSSPGPALPSVSPASRPGGPEVMGWLYPKLLFLVSCLPVQCKVWPLWDPSDPLLFLSTHYTRPGERGSLNPLLKQLIIDDASNDRGHRPLGKRRKASSDRLPGGADPSSKKQGRGEEQHGIPGEWRVIWNIWKKCGRETRKAKARSERPRCLSMEFVLGAGTSKGAPAAGSSAHWVLYFRKGTLALKSQQ